MNTPAHELAVFGIFMTNPPFGFPLDKIVLMPHADKDVPFG
jgi:hypothetical protein